MVLARLQQLARSNNAPLFFFSGKYTLLYGNMLAQTVENASTSDADVEQAVKVCWLE